MPEKYYYVPASGNEEEKNKPKLTLDEQEKKEYEKIAKEGPIENALITQRENQRREVREKQEKNAQKKSSKKSDEQIELDL